MEVYKLSTYRDGGTIKVQTDEGDFYIDKRIDLNGRVKTKGEVFNDYPSEGEILDNSKELRQKIYDSLEGYEDDFYHKRTINFIREFIKSIDK